MSDAPRDPSWWQANDGKWYPPNVSSLPDPPLPDGQWRASKGPTRDQLIAFAIVAPCIIIAALVYLDRWFA